MMNKWFLKLCDNLKNWCITWITLCTINNFILDIYCRFLLRAGLGEMTSCYTIQAVWIYRFTLSYMIQFKRSTIYEAFLFIVVYRYFTFLNAAIWAKAQLFYYSTWKFLFYHHHSFVCKALLNPSFLTCPFHVMFRCFYTWIFGPVLRRPPILEVKKYNVFLQLYRGWKMC